MRQTKTFVRNVFAAALLATTVGAQADENTLRIGVLVDMSGLYADMTGKGSVHAVEMAVADFGGKINGKKIEVVAVDHQNKADIASVKVREWIDAKGVDVVVNLAGSGAALAATDVVKQRNKVALVTGALSSRLTNEACSPNHVHYGLDTYALSRAGTQAVIASGKKKWYFITADYTFGATMQGEATDFIKQAGGSVVGSVKHPLASSDMSSYVLQASASGADVVGLANAGSDLVNTIAQAQAFGLTRGKQSLMPLLLFITDLHAIGLEKAGDILFASPFYWDRNDETRAFAQRFHKKTGRMPSEYQAGDYSAVMHYLKAAQQVGWADGKQVVAKMKEMPVNDFYAQKAYIREDGTLIHDLFLARVKKPSESKYPWDYAEIKSVIPGEQAFQELAKTRCALVKKP